MAFNRLQDFLGNLVSRQRSLFGNNTTSTIDELLTDLMGNTGEVSAIVAARELLDMYAVLDDEDKLAFFLQLEEHYNAESASVKLAHDSFAATPNSANLNRLYRAAEPRRVELLRRLNQTPDATHDLVAMRTDLLRFIKEHPELKAVDENFTHLFRSWFSRGFLLLENINWSTSAAILERIIRYEAVHAIKDWKDLRSRIDPPNRRCFAFFHPALIDEPLIFVEVALSTEIPGSINSILEDNAEGVPVADDFTTATFYSISNCQPGLKNITFGNFLIKQVVQELQHEFPSIKKFVTLSPVPGFKRWLQSTDETRVRRLQRRRQNSWTLGLLTEISTILTSSVSSFSIISCRPSVASTQLIRLHAFTSAMGRCCTMFIPMQTAARRDCNRPMAVWSTTSTTCAT
jgi:malonyl-CoA decarboxylase